jgi:beta-carotene hydroxylase
VRKLGYKPTRRAKRQKVLKCPQRSEDIKALCQADGLKHILHGFIPHFSVYAVLIYLQLTVDNIWLNVLFSVLIGWQLYSLFVLHHDCMHGTAFKKDFYNRLLGRIYSMTFVMTFTVNRSTHMRHHAHISDPERDPDEYYFAGKLSQVWFRIWRYLEWYTMIALTRYGKTIRNTVLIELVFNLAVVALIHYVLYYFGMLEKVIYTTWLPMAVVALVINPITRGYEHAPLTLYPDGDERKLDMSVNTISVTNPFYNLLCANIGLHAEHHAYPRCPFYNLPKLHQIFQEEKLRYLVAPVPLYRILDSKNIVENLTCNPQNP